LFPVLNLGNCGCAAQTRQERGELGRVKCTEPELVLHAAAASSLETENQEGIKVGVVVHGALAVVAISLRSIHQLSGAAFKFLAQL
jgi:hypothetical protein